MAVSVIDRETRWRADALQCKVHRMDISEVWFPLGLLSVPACAWIVCAVAKRIKKGWLRRPIRTMSSAVGVISASIGLVLLLVEAGCTEHVSIQSPDGYHLAVFRYAMQGALGDDYANVSVRRRWNPFAEQVYWGIGSWDFKNNKPSFPEVRWLDASHLLIRYHDRGEPDGRSVCGSQPGGVEVVCELLP